jgi:hypothetical protein
MKDRMIGFYRPSEDEFRTIWKEATFVLDANVILNLYRYPTNAAQDLLGALTKLSDRLWLPFHAALEYQRNRLTIVAEQRKKFVEVRNLIEETRGNLHAQIGKLQLKKRHSTINMEEFLEGFENLTKAFLENLEQLEKGQRNVSDEDKMRNDIDDLVSGSIGPIVFNQDALDDVYKQGEKRYNLKMPPGYMDAEKEKSGEPDSFIYVGLVYKKKFGDLILWKEIISYAKDKAIKCLVLLTDDDKEDWWWTVDSLGKKIIGPRPELVEEIKREGDVDFFYMYNSEQYLKYSKQYLQAEVSEESISQIREVRRIPPMPTRPTEDMRRFGAAAEEAVHEWLMSLNPGSRIERNHSGFPDFIVYEGDRANGFELKVIRDARFFLMRLKESAYRAYYEINERRLDSVTIILAMETVEGLDEAFRFSRRRRDWPVNVKILFGLLETQDESPGVAFRPVGEFQSESGPQANLFDGD